MKKLLLLMSIIMMFSCQSSQRVEPNTERQTQVQQRVYGVGVSVANRPGWEHWEREGADLSLINEHLSAGLIVQHDNDAICPGEEVLLAAFEDRGFSDVSIQSNGSLTEITAVQVDARLPMQVRMRMYCDQPYTYTAMCVHPHMTDMVGAAQECRTILDSLRFE